MDAGTQQDSEGPAEDNRGRGRSEPRRGLSRGGGGDRGHVASPVLGL